MTSQQRKSIISFDPKINMGHLLTIITMAVLAASAFGALESKISDTAHASELRDAEINSKMAQTSIILDNLIQRVEDFEKMQEE